MAQRGTAPAGLPGQGGLGENALFCEVIMPSAGHLYQLITRTLSQLEGVEGWTASMELLFLKRGFVETPWWRTQVNYPPN